MNEPTSSRAADYEALLAELRRQADAQRELVESLTSAVELSFKHKDSGLDALTTPVGIEARNELEGALSKLKLQIAYIEEIERRRDLEL